MTDLTMYPVKNQISLLKANKGLTKVMAVANNFQSVENYIRSLVICSPETLEFFRTKFN